MTQIDLPLPPAPTSVRLMVLEAIVSEERKTA